MNHNPMIIIQLMEHRISSGISSGSWGQSWLDYPLITYNPINIMIMIKWTIIHDDDHNIL